MTHRYLLAATLALGTTAAYALPASFYAPRSVLAEGLWVKIGVSETGVYEISYDELRQMGFSDPTKVGVFGRGGQMLPEAFTDAAGNPLLSDDLRSAGVIHLNDRIYFYGLGPASYSFTPDLNLPTGGRFVNNGRNIYTDLGYYFLTDSEPDVLMPDAAEGAAWPVIVSEGLGMVAHEKDLEYNNTDTGRLFWGEKFNQGHPSRYTWNVELPDALPGEGVMECIFYSTYKDINDQDIKNDWLTYGVDGADSHARITVKKYNTLNFRPQEPLYSSVMTTGADRADIFVEAGSTSKDVANLDYWIFTYPKSTPTLEVAGTHIAQDHILFPGRKAGETLSVPLPDVPGCVAIDITDPTRPLRLRTDGEGHIIMPATSSAPMMALFDVSKPQLRIAGYEKRHSPMANQNLHGLMGQPVELAIICTPALRSQAERLAEVHRRAEGMNVVVADMLEVYNEFSGGIPDPMAYRSFVKMLYTGSPETMKNLLLMGPLYADVRGILAERDPERGMIAYQTGAQSIEKGAFNVNDFYGMMADYSSVLVTNPEQQPMEVGVGVLTFINPVEADRYIDKLERYYAEMDDQVYSLARQLYIGGVGDNHTHDTQATEISEYAENLAFNAAIPSLLPVNAYGHQKAKSKLIEYFNQGTGLALYIGHGAPDRLGSETTFFTNSDVMALRNRIMPFFMIAGCSLTDFDRGQRGMGEKLVVESTNGAIATFCASRDTWSGQNQMLIRQLITSLYRSDRRNSQNKIVYTPHEKIPTLGEVYARTKTLSNYPNDQAYHLIGDPAVRIPVIVRTAELESTPTEIIPVAGQRLSLSGKVVRSDGSHDPQFSGKVIARLIRPEVQLKSEDIVTKEDSIFWVRYRDTQATQTIGTVSGGAFSLALDIPASLSDCVGRTAFIYISALDRETRNGMGLMVPVTVADPRLSGVTPVEDLVPPVVESLVFDPATRSLSAVVSDDTALDLSEGSMYAFGSGYRLYIDGRYDADASSSVICSLDGARRYSRTSALANLSPGEHSARVDVRDAAGNKASAEITFTYTPGYHGYTLFSKEVAATESMEFLFEGKAPATARLVIETTDGREVFAADIASEGYVWDLTDAAGDRVAPGRYRAYVVETGTHQTKGHSNTLTVAVI